MDTATERPASRRLAATVEAPPGDEGSAWVVDVATGRVVKRAGGAGKEGSPPAALAS